MGIRRNPAWSGIAIVLLALGIYFGVRMFGGADPAPGNTAPAPLNVEPREHGRVSSSDEPSTSDPRLDRGQLEEGRAALATSQSGSAQSDATLRGVVVDGQGRGVAMATVWIGRPAGQARPALDPRSVVTDAEGRFGLADIAGDGSFVLAVDHPDYEPMELDDLRPGHAPYAPLTLELRPGAVVTGEFFGSDAAPIAEARVHFEVTLESAKRYGHAILLMQTGGAFGLRRIATTDRDGHFGLRGLWPVAGVVAARSPDGREAHSQEIQLDPLEPRTVTLRLELGGLVEGAVRGPAGPIEAAAVTLSGAHVMGRERLAYQELARPVWRTRSDAGGGFRIEGLRPGTYALEVAAPGHAPHSSDVELADHAWVDVLLERGGSLSGELHGLPEGESATLWLEREPSESTWAGQRAHRRELRSTGSPTPFHFDDVPAGRHAVVAEAKHRASARSEVIEVFAGRESEGAVVHLAEVGGVRGIVRSAHTGSPLAGASVSIVHPKEAVAQDDEAISIPLFFIRQVVDPKHGEGAVTTDEAGRFELVGVRPGEHSVLVTHAEHATTISDAFVLEGAGAWRELELELTAGGFAIGRIETSTGEAVAGEWALLRALPAGAPFWRAQSGENGELAFPRLLAGDYEATLEPRRGSRQALEGQDPFLIFPTLRVRLEEGARARFTLVRDPTSELSGRITSAAGEPVPSYVLLRQVRPGVATLLSYSITRWCRTEAGGEYRLDELEPGEYLFDALPELGAVPVRQLVELHAGLREILDIRLPVAELRGRVVDGEGAPLSGATIRLRPDPIDPRTFPAVRPSDGFEVFDPELPQLEGLSSLGIRPLSSDAQGHFRLPWLPDAGYRLEIRHAESGQHAQTIEVNAARTALLELSVTLEGGAGSGS